jgi:hypothetical protein
MQVSPEPPPQPPPILYTTPAQHQPVPESSFNLIRALGLHADCPCWAWLCIILGFIILLGLIGMCLYFLLSMFLFSAKLNKKIFLISFNFRT